MPAPVCADELEKLYNAIIALQGGAAVTSISFGERAVSYSQSNLKDLLGLYRTFWRQCGTTAGYPDLDPSGSVERGPPARFRYF